MKESVMQSKEIKNYEDIQARFKSLLVKQWQESSIKGRYIARRFEFSDWDLETMGMLNKDGAYSFKEAESSILGETYSVNPERVNEFREYKQIPNGAFVDGLGQIGAGYHTLDENAQGLTVYTLLQCMYRKNGALEQWGNWSLEFNPSSYTPYRIAANEYEKFFFDYLHGSYFMNMEQNVPSDLSCKFGQHSDGGRVEQHRLKISTDLLSEASIAGLQDDQSAIQRMLIIAMNGEKNKTPREDLKKQIDVVYRDKIADQEWWKNLAATNG